MIAPDMDVADNAVQAVVAELARPYWVDGQVMQVGVTDRAWHTRRATAAAATS